jgi:hypothetical protein
MKTQSMIQHEAAALTAHHNERPEWVRLPKPGQRCPHTGLSRTTLNELVVSCPANNYLPPVKSAVIKKRGAMRGIRLISYDSLTAYLGNLCESQTSGGVQ